MATLAAPVRERSGQERKGQIYVALAAIAWSTAGVLQRQLSLDTATQVAGRALFALVALVLFVAVAERGRVLTAYRSTGLAGIGLAACIAGASGGFIAALNHTTVARVLFILAMAPVLAALLGWIFLGERVTARSALAMGVALAGVTVMLGAPGDGDLAGDLLSLGTVLAFSLSLIITRRRRDISMAPATCLSQLMLLVLFAPFASPADIGGRDAWALALLGVGQIGLGLALLMVGARLIPAVQVALITLLEVVLGPIWVWLAYTEQPGAATLAGGAIVVVAIVIQTLATPGRARAVPPP